MRFAFKSHAAHILITAFLCHPFPDNTLGEPCGLNLHSRNTHKKQLLERTSCVALEMRRVNSV